MKKKTIIFVIIGVLFLASFFICMFAPYINYPDVTTIFSSGVTTKYLSCVDILKNSDKLGIYAYIVKIFIAIIALKVILAVSMFVPKGNKVKLCGAIIVEAATIALHIYFMSCMDNFRNKFLGIAGFLMNAAGIKFSGWFYLNIGVSGVIILLSVYILVRGVKKASPLGDGASVLPNSN